ncbi:MAG: NYN domain-containing protein [Chloroflexota bacterium]
MHYLIDGHNLIGKMPDISLADPDDEVQLVFRLRGWTAQRKKRKVTVIFDGGLPGGKDVKLSTPSVRVIFAQEGRTADSLLIARIFKAKNPGEFTAVSSDNQIIEAAKQKRMPLLKSENFVMKMGQQAIEKRIMDTAVEDKTPHVSQEEVNEWLELFGPVPERPPAPKPTKKKKLVAKQTAQQRKKAFAKKDWSKAKHDDVSLSDDDISEWLDLFGG